jgi:aryl sulfotransferase
MADTHKLPVREFCYQGFLSDGKRWDRFTHRPDDAFVCTLGKHGTTWMQAICALLIFQTPELDFNPAERSPWLDVTFEPIDDTIALLEAQTQRRVIKTHTCLDGIPFHPECTYITVYRDPRDAFFSMRNHMGNMKMEVLGLPKIDILPAEEAFQGWVDAEYEPGTEAPALAFSAHHLLSYHAFSHLPNIHFFHYSDLRRDLAGEMQKIAGALGVEVAPELLPKLADAASFENMKRNADRFAPGAKRGAWHETERFFHQARQGGWRDELSQEVLAKFDTKLTELVGPELAQWWQNGSAARAAK